MPSTRQQTESLLFARILPFAAVAQLLLDLLHRETVLPSRAAGIRVMLRPLVRNLAQVARMLPRTPKRTLLSPVPLLQEQLLKWIRPTRRLLLYPLLTPNGLPFMGVKKNALKLLRV